MMQLRLNQPVRITTRVDTFTYSFFKVLIPMESHFNNFFQISICIKKIESMS